MTKPDLIVHSFGFNATNLFVDGVTQAGRDFLREFIFGKGCTMPVTGAEILKSEGLRLEQALVGTDIKVDWHSDLDEHCEA